jgi:hypothetical protein
VVCAPDQFVSRIEGLMGSAATRARMGENARTLAVRRYAWSLIAAAAAQSIRAVLRGNQVHVS